MELTKVIKSPILTEKSDRLRSNEKNPVFTFKVDYAANKYQIKEAVETIFNVKVESVNTIKIDKQPRNIGRYHGFSNRYKKAMVKLAEGSNLNYLPSDEQEAKIVSDDKKVAKKEAKAKKSSDVEAKVAKKIATKKSVATKTTAVKKPATTKRKVGGE